MQTAKEKGTEDFFFTSITWREVSDKVVFPNLDVIRQALNAHLSLSNYGTGVKEIAYIFVALRPSNTLHSESLSYSKIKKEVFIQKKLPYELVEAYSESDVLSLMAVAYLQSLQDLSKRKIVDFDGQRLYTDVQQLFAEKGWLDAVETPAITSV